MTKHWQTEIRIAGHLIGEDHPTCFIADIGSNHDGDLQRAKDLIYLAKESGADVAKFQHFSAASLASDYGFRHVQGVSFLKNLTKPIYEIYQDVSINPEWTPTLAETCREAGITFMTTPTSPALVDELDSFVPAYKIGSGDLTWSAFLEYVAQRNKPVLLATGLSTADEVHRAVEAILRYNGQLVLLQCNTNYSGSSENFRHAHLNVLKTFQTMYPGMLLGLSDHTPGHAAALGAIALGARVIEKHFTDDNTRPGADHAISMDAAAWKEMMARARELEMALGSGVKTLEDNEKEWVIMQRRALRATRALKQGSVLREDMFAALRPCPREAIPPYDLPSLVGRSLLRDLNEGEHVTWRDIGDAEA